METASRNSWKTLPMPQESAILPYTAAFTPEAFATIARGLIPQGMDDRWFIYLEGETLNLHRSWTGFCIYQVEFARDADKFIVQRVLVNRDQSQHSNVDDAEDAAVLRSLIHGFLLGDSAHSSW